MFISLNDALNVMVYTVLLNRVYLTSDEAYTLIWIINNEPNKITSHSQILTHTDNVIYTFHFKHGSYFGQNIGHKYN